MFGSTLVLLRKPQTSKSERSLRLCKRLLNSFVQVDVKAVQNSDTYKPEIGLQLVTLWPAHVLTSPSNFYVV